MAKEFFEYKGKPLVRNKNTIYYGDMADPFVVMMQIMSTKQAAGMELPDRVAVQLMSTDPKANPQEIVVKRSEKNGLYAAVDIASIWLKRALAQQL